MISAHRSNADPQKRGAYIQLALPAIEKGGGKFWQAPMILLQKKMASKNKRY